MIFRTEANAPDETTTPRRTYELLSCEACGNVSLSINYWVEADPFLGDAYVEKVEHVPPLAFRPKPQWYSLLPDEYSRVLDEVYTALDHRLFILASAGVRTSLDRLLLARVGDVGTFKDKCAKLKADGHIDDDQKQLLEAVIDAGSASAHRGFVPGENQMVGIIDIAEHLLYRLCVSPLERGDLLSKAADLKDSTPKRRK